MPAGAVTITTDTYPDANVVKYTLLWESDASGDVNGHQLEISEAIRYGTLQQIKFMPTGGPQPPDDLYDVQLVETASPVDFLGGLGADLSNTTATIVRPTAPLFWDPIDSALDLVVTNAGNTAFGTVKLWFVL